MPMLTTLRMRLPVCPSHRPLRIWSEKAAIRSRTACTSGHDVGAVDDNPLALRRAQGDVEHGALFGHVDLFAAEHRFDARAQAALLGKVQQQPQRFVGDAILGVIEVEAGGFGRESLAAPGIVGEKLPQVPMPHRFVMRLQRFPRRALRQRRRPHFGLSHRWFPCAMIVAERIALQHAIHHITFDPPQRF